MSEQTYQLHLTGFVGGYDFDRQYVDFVLNENADKAVNVLIDSLGGSLATALSIASAFRQHGNVSVHFVGMNASAATIASLGAKHVSMDASAMYLAHKCSTSFFEWGSLNADQLQSLQDNISQMKSDLDKMDANVAQMYASKSGKPVADLLDLMKVGGWLSAKEALEWGFVDEITDWEEAAPVLTDTVASAMADAGIPIPTLSKEARSQEKSEGALFARFISALTAFFKGNTAKEPHKEDVQVHNTIMKKIYSLLGEVLKVEDFASEDGKAVLTDAQLQSIEDELEQSKESLAQVSADLQAKSAEVDALKTEVAELQKHPAEPTTQVVDNGSKLPKQEKSDAENYIDTVNSARGLFYALP